MALSRQFRALLKFAGFWALPFAALGAVMAFFRWTSPDSSLPAAASLARWVLTHLLGYGGLGLISGLNAGLLLARAERGRRVEELSTGRVALWSAIGGAGPAVLFAVLGKAFGAPAGVYLPLVGLGVVSAAVSGAIAIGVVAAANRGVLPTPSDPPQLGAKR